jgi:hypothetical protein
MVEEAVLGMAREFALLSTGFLETNRRTWINLLILIVARWMEIAPGAYPEMEFRIYRQQAGASITALPCYCDHRRSSIPVKS